LLVLGDEPSLDLVELVDKEEGGIEGLELVSTGKDVVVLGLQEIHHELMPDRGYKKETELENGSVTPDLSEKGGREFDVFEAGVAKVETMMVRYFICSSFSPKIYLIHTHHD